MSHAMDQDLRIANIARALAFAFMEFDAVRTPGRATWPKTAIRIPNGDHSRHQDYISDCWKRKYELDWED
jgi:hypothetical protein